MTFTKTIIKGYPEYTVTADDGTEIARSHCVQVQANLFSIIIGGKWAGVLPEDKAVAALRALTA